jgi:hypothetical protein
MLNSLDLNKEKENILLNSSTTENCASLFEDQDSDRESFFSPRQKKRINLEMEKLIFVL